MARNAGTPVPMKLPSGQVVWVRVEDQEPEPPAPPFPPAPWEQAYAGVPVPPPAYTYDDGSPYPAPSPGGAAPASPGAPAPQQWVPYETGPASDQGSPGGPYPQQPGGPVNYGAPYPAPGAPAGQGGGWLDRLRPKRVVEHTAEDARQLQGFTEAVSGIAESVRDGLRHAKPDTVEIEFGLDIDVSAGAAISLIADARAKAAVRITLGWDNRERGEGRARVIEGSSEESGDARG